VGLTVKKVYLDSCILIYLIEAHPVFQKTIQQLLDSESGPEIFTSDLVRLECKVHPLRHADHELATAYEEYLDGLALIDLNRSIFDRGAGLRASFPFIKTPDALHLAAAEFGGCDEFWTNDEQLVRVLPSLVKVIL